MKSQGHKTGRRADGFTLVELLVVIGIIGILLSILVPTVNVAITQAKVASTKAMLHAISVGLNEFQNDTGSYPDSTRTGPPSRYALDTGENPTNKGCDTGAHHLVNALAGIDLRGYSTTNTYYLNTNDTRDRKKPYIDLQNMNVVNFRQLESISAEAVESQQEKMNYLTDPNLMENLNPLFVDPFDISTKPRAILYYKAYKRGNNIHEIYNFFDNQFITNTTPSATDGRVMESEWVRNNPHYSKYAPNVIKPTDKDWKDFEFYLWNPNTGINIGTTPPIRSASAKPYNPDSFILISAGKDREYGTADDIVNFERKE